MSSNKCLIDTTPPDFDIGLHCFHFCCIPTFPWSRREDYSSCIELPRGLRKTAELRCVKHDVASQRLHVERKQSRNYFTKLSADTSNQRKNSI